MNKEKEHSFILTLPTSVYKLLPPPYARPSRVAYIIEAIREKSQREREQKPAAQEVKK